MGCGLGDYISATPRAEACFDLPRVHERLPMQLSPTPSRQMPRRRDASPEFCIPHTPSQGPPRSIQEAHLYPFGNRRQGSARAAGQPRAEPALPTHAPVIFLPPLPPPPRGAVSSAGRRVLCVMGAPMSPRMTGLLAPAASAQFARGLGTPAYTEYASAGG